MPEIMIVVAATEGGLDAVAESAGLKLLRGTTFPFAGLETFSEPVMTKVGVISTSLSGFVAFAVEKSAAPVETNGMRIDADQARHPSPAPSGIAEAPSHPPQSVPMRPI